MSCKNERELMAKHVLQHHAEFNNPSVSVAQHAAMEIAKHNPSKLYARNKGLLKMKDSQLDEFTANSPKGLPYKKS